MQVTLPISAVLAALVFAGCGDDSSDALSNDRAEVVAHKTEGKDAGVLPEPQSAKTFAEDSQLSAGSRIALLSLPGVGKLLVSCDADGAASTAFKAANGLATADIVVTSEGGETADGILNPRRTFDGPSIAPPGFQTWSIAEFAAGDVRPTMIRVASRKVDSGGTNYQCAVAAQAMVGAPTSTNTQ